MTTEKTNRELVNAGFTFAKQISGLTPVKEIVKMIGDLATRLDVVSVRSNALAAENSLLDAHISGISDAYENGLRDLLTNEIDAAISCETPATDFAVRKICADAIDEMARQKAEEWRQCYIESAKDYADQLRAGMV